MVRLNGLPVEWEAACTNWPLNKPCSYVIHHLEVGPYSLDAKAVDKSGNEDPSPPLVQWAVVSCSMAQFAALDAGTGAAECQPCPSEGAYCGVADGDNITESSMHARPGYWTTGSSSNQFLACPLVAACVGGNTTVKSRCASGHTEKLWYVAGCVRVTLARRDSLITWAVLFVKRDSSCSLGAVGAVKSPRKKLMCLWAWWRWRCWLRRAFSSSFVMPSQCIWFVDAIVALCSVRCATE